MLSFLHPLSRYDIHHQDMKVSSFLFFFFLFYRNQDKKVNSNDYKFVSLQLSEQPFPFSLIHSEFLTASISCVSVYDVSLLCRGSHSLPLATLKGPTKFSTKPLTCLGIFQIIRIEQCTFLSCKTHIVREKLAAHLLEDYPKHR